MAEVAPAVAPRPGIPSMWDQFAAIARLRWHIFTHSLKTTRGRLEMVSWIFMGLGYFVIAVFGTIGLAVLSWFLVSHNHAQWFAAPLWLIFLFWQLFPVMATAFTENFDASNFLRFPLTYRAYFMIRMAYGTIDPTTIIGCLWLAAMTVGAAVASPSLALWAVLVFGSFAALNILLARMIFSWIERWLARRKSREILGVFFFLIIICFQFISPLTQFYLRHYTRAHRQPEVSGFALQLLTVQKFFPPGLASSAMSFSAQSDFGPALLALLSACVYAAAFFALLNVRLLAQYRGENLSEAVAPAISRKGKQAVSVGWELGRGVSGSVSAVFEKEFRYLSRSGPMLFPLVMPIVILLIMRFGVIDPRHAPRFLTHGAGFVFPIGAAYTLLILSGITFNCFGTEGGGVQFYFMSPVRFREILLAKNIAVGLIFALELVLVWTAVAFFFVPPSPGITFATLIGAFFAVLVMFIAGNLMSLYAPRKIDWGSLGRQRASNITGLVVLAVQAVMMGFVGIAIFAGVLLHEMWPVVALLALFAAGAFWGYNYALGEMDALAIKRRESMIAEICRT
jgi:ABC-2 type transport system permease protein